MMSSSSDLLSTGESVQNILDRLEKVVNNYAVLVSADLKLRRPNLKSLQEGKEATMLFIKTEAKEILEKGDNNQPFVLEKLNMLDTIFEEARRVLVEREETSLSQDATPAPQSDKVQGVYCKVFLGSDADSDSASISDRRSDSEISL